MFLSRGSRASRIQSPSRLNASTVSSNATPGIVLTHQAVRKKFRPSDTMEPHAGVGGGTPAPKKLRMDSRRMTTLTCRVATTITVLSTPGSRWAARMRMVEQPDMRARDT